MIHIQSDFKTIELTVFFTDIDQKTYDVYRYILPRLLISHTNKITSKKMMSEQLENLYGAQILPRVERIANLNVLSLTLSIVHPKIVLDDQLFDLALDLFNQVLFEHDHFDSDIFDIEKRNIIESWQILKDRKRSYASFMFNELFFEGDLMSYPISGTLKDIKKLTVNDMNHYYHDIFLKNTKRLLVNGNLSQDELSKIKKLSIEEPLYPFHVDMHFRKPRELVIKKEETIMNQAIIKIGYIVPIFRYDQLYPAACLFETVLGGYPESRLFIEIRENQGLCYDISASYEPYKGVLTISSGVDTKKMDYAIEAIKSLVEHMINEGITEQELKHSKAYYVHQLKSSIDDQSINTKRAYLNELFKINETIEERIFNISNVTPSDIKKVCEAIKIDTIYVLHGGTN